MGRKRTSNKRDVKLKVDNEILDLLVELNVNKSLLFTEAAKKKIDELTDKSKNKE